MNITTRLSFMAAIAVTVFLNGPIALADQSYKDWNLIEGVEDPLFKTQVCHAFTQVSDAGANAPVPVGLSLIFPKGQEKAPGAFIKVDPSIQATQILIKTSSKVSEPALAIDLPASDGTIETFWYIPMNMQTLINKIAAANDLEIIVQTQGSETPVLISLAGSSKILQETRKCIGTSTLFSDQFFKDLTLKDAPAYPVEGEMTLERAFEFYQTSYTYHLEAARATTALEALRKEHRGIIKEEQTALANFDAAQKKYNDAKAALEANDTARAQNEQSIKANQAKLQTLASEKGAAEQDLAAKKAVYEPIRQEAKAFTDRIANAQSRVNSATSRIRSLKNSIANARSEIESLKSEASNLESSIRRAESSLSGLESDLSSAERNLRSFDVDRAAREILERDFSYRSAKSDLERAQREVGQLRSEVRRHQGDVQRARQDLQRCERAPNPDPGNCMRERSELSRAEGDLRQADSRLDRVEREIQNLDWRIRNLEDSARREAESQRSRLQNEVNRLASEVSNLESQIRSARSRVRSIFDFEIPSREQTIRDANGEIPRQEASLDAARRELSAAQAEYESFKATKQFDRIKGEYDQAVATLNGINKSIETANAEIKSSQAKIVKLDKERPVLVQTLTKRETTLKDMTAKLEEVRSRMTDFKAKEAQLVQAVTTMQQGFDQARGLYKTIVDQMMN